MALASRFAFFAKLLLQVLGSPCVQLREQVSEKPVAGEAESVPCSQLE